jgi:uncharacterized membrane protein
VSNGRSPAIEESSTVIIGRAPIDVWEYVSDLEKTPTWRTTVTGIEPPSVLEVGERFAGTTRLLGRTWTWLLELTAVEPGERLEYVVVEGIVEPYVAYRVEPEADETRFTMTGRIDRFGLAGRLLKPFALPALRRETDAHLKNLKRILESG